MKVIVPMAGRGSRLRPHTLTVPKPLIPVGGKPIVHRLVEDIISVCGASVNKIGFVIGDFGEEVEEELLRVSASFGAVFSQDLSALDHVIRKDLAWQGIGEKEVLGRRRCTRKRHARAWAVCQRITTLALTVANSLALSTCAESCRGLQ